MGRVLSATILIAALTAPALAQVSTGGKQPTPLDLQYERERKDQEANAKAYEEHMKRQKSLGSSSAAKSDPWAGARQPSGAGTTR